MQLSLRGLKINWKKEEKEMKKIILAVSILVAMTVVFGFPSLVMAQCASDTDCNDSNDCTDDTCDTSSGNCVFTNDDTNTCSDGNICTDDACMSGACVSTADCTNDASCNLGEGPGCSAVEGVDATTLVIGNCFTGKIGVPGVTGLNKNGKPADNSDTDAFTDSLEACINDALVGFCTTILGDEDGVIDLDPGDVVGNNQQWFTVTILGACGTSQCSDHVDNEIIPDGLIDFPDDPQCTDYNDNDESS
jgi:hypothetical protein